MPACSFVLCSGSCCWYDSVMGFGACPPACQRCRAAAGSDRDTRDGRQLSSSSCSRWGATRAGHASGPNEPNGRGPGRHLDAAWACRLPRTRSCMDMSGYQRRECGWTWTVRLGPARGKTTRADPHPPLLDAGHRPVRPQFLTRTDRAVCRSPGSKIRSGFVFSSHCTCFWLAAGTRA